MIFEEDFEKSRKGMKRDESSILACLFLCDIYVNISILIWLCKAAYKTSPNLAFTFLSFASRTICN